MKLKSIIITLSLILALFNLSAQDNYTRDIQLEVYKQDSSLYKHAFTGGFNHIQFSEIDLNLDGTNDLIAFDRSGFKVSTFINNGISGVVDYTYTPKYIDSLPSFESWVLFRDYNCDGKQDILTYFSGGVKVYKNTSTTSLSFELVTNAIQSDYLPDDGNDNRINLYISSTDIAAFDDIDNDGDLDILTFGVSGTNVEYHKNLSQELYGTCDSLRFILTNKCWGYFSENLSDNSVTLFDTCNFNVANPESQLNDENAKKHSGSSLLTLDVDANNSRDLVLGDITFNNMTLLYNSDNTTNLTAASMTVEDQSFPSNLSSTAAVDINIFPAGFYLDVNNDNVKDLLVSTNCNSGCENYESSWLYLNNGATNLPDFSFNKTNFLQEDMIELGEGANPVFFDYNDDGLLDLVIGNFGEFDNSLSLLYKPYLSLYKNIGTAANPAFKLVDSDFAGLSTMNLDLGGGTPVLGLTPTFGDLDNDGDKDMILGDYLGNIHYFTNTAGAGNDANFVLNQVKYQGIDVGSFAAPFLVDLNRNGKLDLVIGKNNGYFTFYENTGTVSAPFYSKKTDSLGYVSTLEPGFFVGRSTPFIYEDAGEYKMLAGSSSGYIFKYDNIEGNLTGSFNKVDSAYLNLKEGKNTSIALADITNDGRLDMMIGNDAGGISYFKGTFPVSVGPEYEKLEGINLYPNPTKELLTIDLGTNNLKNASLQVLDLLGKTITTQKVSASKTTINLNGLSQGVYLVKFSSELGSKVFKVLKE
jgi:type IX secretion system substrate protein